jgi:hypothetical protein
VKQGNTGKSELVFTRILQSFKFKDCLIYDVTVNYNKLHVRVCHLFDNTLFKTI